MQRITVLSPGYLSANSQSFLFPLLHNRNLLRDQQIQIRFVSEASPNILECDKLLIDSKFYKEDWSRSPLSVIDDLAWFSERIGEVLWFHTGDSAGTLGAHIKKILPYVKGVYKSQTYKDKSLYQRNLYGNRLYTDYYHRQHGVVDSEPADFDPVLTNEELKKINVSWNIGYARCFDFRGTYVSAAYKRFPSLKMLLQVKPRIKKVTTERPLGVYARMGLNFPRKTIGYQRRQFAALVGPQERVSRRIYYKEMKESKIVVSPFGWGEINTRDFESFIYGNLLIKPSMDHLDTFPNFFIPNETFLPYRWDHSDMGEVLSEAENHYEFFRSIAIEAQRRYVDETVSLDGREKFVAHFRDLVCF